MRHAMTIGELAQLFNEQFGIGCELEVCPMRHWRRDQFFMQTGLPWIPPSPNLPTASAAMVYPGQVIWEGTNISEGRGTALPFELFGAPFIDPFQLLTHVDPAFLGGMFLRPTVFEPTANKWSGAACRGFHIHITDPKEYRPYMAALALLQGIIRLYPNHFEWKFPPYEYEHHRMPIDLILGDRDLRRRIEALEPLDTLLKDWQPSVDRFRTMSRKYHLYRDCGQPNAS
jgi:uncharacterized protein YbbC (DUF1343 family)